MEIVHIGSVLVGQQVELIHIHIHIRVRKKVEQYTVVYAQGVIIVGIVKQNIKNNTKIEDLKKSSIFVFITIFKFFTKKYYQHNI